MPTITSDLFQEWMKRAKTKRDIQRVQCVGFHLLQQLSSADIARVVCVSPVTVRRVWIAFADQGEEALFEEKRGGRHHEHLGIEEEKLFLRPFIKQAHAGGFINIKPVHRALEKKVGKTIPASTTYAMLHRQGWRKIAPRAHHPQGNPIAREKFKASFPPDRATGKARGGDERSDAPRSL
jgi:transposase